MGLFSIEPTINQTMETEAPTASAPLNKKEGKGMLIGMIACAVLAVAGIGFDVYYKDEQYCYAMGCIVIENTY